MTDAFFQSWDSLYLSTKEIHYGAKDMAGVWT